MVNGMRMAIESLYSGKCDVYEVQKIINQVNKRTTREWVKIIENQPCRLSYSSSAPATDEQPSEKSQKIKLFIAPELTIKAGSRIDVTQNNVTKQYESSGEPLAYSCHQEIELKLREEET